MKSRQAAAQRLRLEGAMRTHVGAVRPHNEDDLVYVAPQDGDPAAARGSLMLVADGMGGHAAGEVASALAAKTVRRVFYEQAGSLPEVLGAAFLAANRAILAWAKANPECKGMGTTCTAMAVREGQAWLAHVGDSRAYLLRDGVMTQLSDDQTLVAQMVREGKLTAKEAQSSPISNVILQALGSNADVVPVVWADPLQLAAGDILVLCTDGLSGIVADETIAEHVKRLPPGEACDALIEVALAAGAPDNVSVGVFRLVAEAKRRDEERSAASTHTTTRRVGPAVKEAAGHGSAQRAR
jgi:serine/threonine protein phosphatase PrpC